MTVFQQKKCPHRKTLLLSPIKQPLYFSLQNILQKTLSALNALICFPEAHKNYVPLPIPVHYYTFRKRNKLSGQYK